MVVHIQEGVITLPKSVNPDRIKSNLDIFDFKLNKQEMDSIRALDTGVTTHNPDDPEVEKRLLNAIKIEQ